MRVELAIDQGGASPNEDWAGATTSLFVVLDGLTSPRDLPTGCRHGVPWFVKNLGASLLRFGQDHELDLPSALAQSIDTVADSHRETCDVISPGTPSSTVTIGRLRGGELEWLVLADSVALVDLDGTVQAVSDSRVDSATSRERTLALESPVGTPEHETLVKELVAAQRRVRNSPGGYWVAGSNKEAAYQAVTGSADVASVRRMALLTDGANRLSEFGILNPSQTLDVMASGGPAELIRQVRETEAADPEGVRWPRYKRSDDAGAVFVSL
ncbi:protein phosphatase 2C domain-containing protein [Actinoalloteichus sp. GBA129-24]|uniref:protein phosphatase 2C domain-containing protein n=1 Tax=Actinoalloteichus sp. GBA129-24 TaxID=1612551 RepID=UPI000950B100|nr:protein phosphatase 2C domain-containing protein [Actinoalloteichus sp. GBA129-24]APU18596.1 Protein phosphatase 2C [Actinoalloteichus sp. GBA129-24]